MCGFFVSFLQTPQFQKKTNNLPCLRFLLIKLQVNINLLLELFQLIPQSLELFQEDKLRFLSGFERNHAI